MKSGNLKTKSENFFVVVIILISMHTSEVVMAQRMLVANAGIGRTSVDLIQWSGYSSLYDWGQTMNEGYVQYYFRKLNQINIGLEAGYQYFFWYEYDYFDGYYHNYYEYEVSCWRIMAMARKDVGTKLFSEFGLGFYMFDGFSDLGLTGSIGYEIGLNDKFWVPIKFRAAVVYDEDANLAVFGISAGLAYRH